MTLRNNRRRRAAGIVLVDGARETLRAIESGMKLNGFYEPVDGAGQFLVEVDGLPEARKLAMDRGVHRGVTSELFTKICYGDAMQRCVAEFQAPSENIADLSAPRPGLILVLDQIEKPGNLGAVFRTADAARVSTVLICDCPTDPFNPNAIRGSLGAVFTVPSASGTLEEVNAYLVKHARHVYGMRVEGAGSLFDVDLRADHVAVILGSEANGLGARWQTWGPAREVRPVEAVKLPMGGFVDSLNLSVSAAIVAYEAVRQRGG